METRGQSEFCIKIDFEKGVGNPSRVFRAMSDLIDTLQDVDRSLISSIDGKLEPILLLEDVETGSVKAWLRQVIGSVDDDALKKGDWKGVVGNYLLKGKYLIISFLDKKTEITNTAEIDELEKKLLKAAEDTGVNEIPAYNPPSRQKLLQDIEKINTALSPLRQEDKVTYLSSEGDAEFNLHLYLAPDQIQDLITSEVIETFTLLIMKVKKPDFLGESKWEFKYDGKSLEVKMLDEQWVADYQSGTIPLHPGDAIKAEVMVSVRYGFDREIISTQYSVQKVLEVIPKKNPDQKLLFP